jgi:hypothetical protein
MTPKPAVRFSELRGDWYRGADLMARLIDQSRKGTPELIGFPAQWIPLFEHFDANWSDPIAPLDYVPLISDLPIDDLYQITSSARRQGRLRVFVESVASLDPLVADVLHKLDRRVNVAVPPIESSIEFTGWQSYGRPEILDFDRRVLCHSVASVPTAALLPCARRRPYRESKTHKRLTNARREMDSEPADEIVISSLGVIPSSFWNDPVVIAYNSGVPDIYRVLRIMRAFFSRVLYDTVIDCLEFEPYRDCVRIIQREGLINSISPGPQRRIRKLPRP